jgi:hypothetical protein
MPMQHALHSRTKWMGPTGQDAGSLRWRLRPLPGLY